MILNGCYAVDFTLDLELKDLVLFQSLAEQHQIPLELSPLAVDIVADALDQYGPVLGRHKSSNDSKTTATPSWELLDFLKC